MQLSSGTLFAVPVLRTNILPNEQYHFERLIHGEKRLLQYYSIDKDKRAQDALPIREEQQESIKLWQDLGPVNQHVSSITTKKD